MSWEGFKYAPVRGLFERIQRRINRTHRRTMLRNFAERGLDAFALRMKALRDNVKLHGERKMVQFRRVLDEYAALVTGGTQAPTGGQATHYVEEGAVGMPSA
jgi:hypothetical protein